MRPASTFSIIQLSNSRAEKWGAKWGIAENEWGTNKLLNLNI